MDAIKEGMKGFLVITTMNKEKPATQEAYHLLNLIEEANCNSREDDPANAAAEVELSLEEELAKLRNKKHTFNAIPLKCPCMIFIQSESSQCVVDMANTVFLRGRKESKFIQKIIPVQGTTVAKYESIRNVVKDIVKDQKMEKKEGSGADEANTKPPLKVSVQFRHRFDGGKFQLDRNTIQKECMEGIREVMSDYYITVDYKEYDLIIFIEVVMRVAMISVLKGSDFKEFKKYNVHSYYGNS